MNMMVNYKWVLRRKNETGASPATTTTGVDLELKHLHNIAA